MKLESSLILKKDETPSKESLLLSGIGGEPSHETELARSRSGSELRTRVSDLQSTLLLQPKRGEEVDLEANKSLARLSDWQTPSL